jgi:nucleotide-binding universal stress UspA family protein
MMKSILLAVDGSTYTDAQVKHCIQLAKSFQAQVRILSVVDIRIVEWAVVMGTDGFVPVTPSAVYKEETRKMLEEKADAVLDKCATILSKENIQFDVEKIQGPPADVIYERSHLVDLLVIGSRGEFAKWRKKQVGATLDAVVRLWNKPVFVTQATCKKTSKLLFAYDGSEKANKALQLGALFASQLQLPMVIISVHDRKQIRDRYLNEARTYLEPYKIDIELISCPGNPEKEIIRVSDEKQCDLTVIGAFGHSRIREAILGSTTEHVLRRINTPLLLAK